ncbi:protein kinase [bacterium AH-315-I20]|nr:protein kinase [bacterium AH-315-I20]
MNCLFDDLTCVSFEEDGKKRGCFSLVFTATHKVTEDKVVLKFYDPTQATDEYRLSCFKREPEILKVLKGKRRCLQLIQDLTKFKFRIDVSEGRTLTVNAEYFVTECVNEEVDPYFLSQQNYEATQKVKLFRQILLSVKMIHQHEVFHRDIKPDNIRMSDSAMNEVKLIDFGTSAEYESINLLKDYDKQVGAPAYAAPEAFLGFAGERNMAFLTDTYALGCLLFELFNTDIFIARLIKEMPYETVLTAMKMELSTCSNESEKMVAYERLVDDLHRVFLPPAIDGDGSTLPASISGLINRLYTHLVSFDFRERTKNLDDALRLLDSSTKVLSNHQWDKSRLARKRAIRKRKLEKIREQDERLLGYLSRRRALNA